MNVEYKLELHGIYIVNSCGNLQKWKIEEITNTSVLISNMDSVDNEKRRIKRSDIRNEYWGNKYQVIEKITQ